MFLLEYLKLTAPRISLLVMLTGYVGLWMGARGKVEPTMILPCLAGIGFAAAGASVFNNYFDRDIDGLMERTRDRPLPSGRLNPAAALAFGVLLSMTSFLILVLFSGIMPAFLALAAIFIYSVLYTVILKRRTPLATEIGSLSGALPPVIGWVASRSDMGIGVFVLFTMMFVWQPPHFWSLAMSHRDDYRRARIPSMPLTGSEDGTKKRSFIYILLLVFASFMPYVFGMSGRIYFAVSVFLGCLYILLGLTGLLLKKKLNRCIFYYSILYLSACFIIMSVDIQK
jgi:protoheme IX farnesyltransferase